METIIRINPSELNENLLDKIRYFIGNKNNIDVTISLKEYDPEYVDILNISIEEAEKEKNIVSFNMENFISYTPAK